MFTGKVFATKPTDRLQKNVPLEELPASIAIEHE